MTSLPRPISQTDSEITMNDLEGWLKLGVTTKDEIKDPIDGCVLLVDDAENLFELCQ
ncbi:MAG: hypothetical protein R3Y57_07065 [Erysipelotrichaceae bacterium]